MIHTYHIHITGIVQGVGFRPFVYKFAIQNNLKGWVNNTNDGVHIEINANEKQSNHFLKILLDNLPPLAIVTGYTITQVAENQFTNFEIIQSNNNTKPNLLITPDVAMCNDCKNELHKSSDRRYQYPFITCTNCGPRYSIISKLPYDRPFTTMQPFKMCDICWEEYNNPLERRHFSQTNSCPDCSIAMQLFENDKITENFNDLEYIVRQWEEGKIIAIKGIGGYLLTCDATNKNAIQLLRKRKNRPIKPFALMYPDLQSIQKDVLLSNEEEKELLSIHAPIVLLQKRKNLGTNISLHEINNDLSRIGIMLPYTPLYELLLNKFNKPIVATSGNISNSTIIFEDQLAIDELSKIADIILLNNRDIVVPQDDGVVQFSPEHQQKIVLRRSRGKAPIYINPNLQIDKNILATGSMLKSVFSFSHQNNIYVSQYLGNTASYEAQKNYEYTYQHLTKILEPHFSLVVTDKHPDYFATRFGKEIAEKNKIEHIEIQHHKAHFYSVLGEHNLLKSKEKIMGVIWDGTGLGTDQNIWGGEFFIYENKSMKRMHHIGEFDFILADKMVKEPRISALAIAHHIKGASKYLQNKFTDTEWKIYQQLLQNTRLKSTSMGRLFDAVSSLLFNNDIHGFEAEASIKLEQSAYKYIKHKKAKSYLQTDVLPINFVEFIITKIINDLDHGVHSELIAAKFHISLVNYVELIAHRFHFKQIAFSGGVFQNALLVDLIINSFSNEYNLYFQKEFSPNDEGIPFGQLMYVNQRINN
jgi:hydrogenase maturation protein HypF